MLVQMYVFASLWGRHLAVPTSIELGWRGAVGAVLIVHILLVPAVLSLGKIHPAPSERLAGWRQVANSVMSIVASFCILLMSHVLEWLGC
jgi:hypothetical protein